MKRTTVTILALLALTFAVIGCHNTEDANEKIEECLEEEYGAEQSDEYMSQLELDCEDGEEACDECVDCVMDAECEDLLDGTCNDLCG